MEILDSYSVQNLKNGDHKTFENIFYTFFSRLMTYSKEYVIDLEAAREIVQDSFVKLWENRQQLNDNSNISAFLFTLVRNSSLNYLRQMITRKKYIEYSQYKYHQYLLNYTALLDDSAENLLYRELEEKIKDVIEQLPEKCKTVFELSRLNNLKHKEIASKLNISVKTVENHIAEALRRIHVQLEEYL
jgi:RNA polymerase sigma-70 factor (ECF subfamily)